MVPGPWGRATDMWGKAAGRCSLQGKPAVLTAILRTELRQTETHTSVRARSTGKGLKRFPKPSTMSSDAKEAKTYNGDKKEDWKAFYDEAVRICRQELGSAGVEWFNGRGPPALLVTWQIGWAPYLGRARAVMRGP